MIPARTLQECALLAARVVKPELGDMQAYLEKENAQLAEQAGELKQKLNPDQRYLRGLFSGGTLCYEAQVIWKDHAGQPGPFQRPAAGRSSPWPIPRRARSTRRSTWARRNSPSDARTR